MLKLHLLKVLWDEFSEQHQHQSIKNTKIPIDTFLVQIRCRFHAHFIWVINIQMFFFLNIILNDTFLFYHWSLEIIEFLLIIKKYHRLGSLNKSFPLPIFQYFDFIAIVKIRNIFLYKEGNYTVQKKDDIDSGTKTKTRNLALLSCVNMLYSGRYGDPLYSAYYYINVF